MESFCDQIIKHILEYCDLSFYLFLINNRISKIYSEIIYTDELVKKLFNVAAYEKNQYMIDLLDKKFNIFDESIINYWSNRNYNSFVINFSMIGKNNVTL